MDSEFKLYLCNIRNQYFMLKFMTRIITLMLMLLFAALSTVMNADDKGSGNTDDKTAQRIPFYQIGKDLIKDKPRICLLYTSPSPRDCS